MLSCGAVYYAVQGRSDFECVAESVSVIIQIEPLENTLQKRCLIPKVFQNKT